MRTTIVEINGHLFRVLYHYRTHIEPTNDDPGFPGSLMVSKIQHTITGKRCHDKGKFAEEIRDKIWEAEQ